MNTRSCQDERYGKYGSYGNSIHFVHFAYPHLLIFIASIFLLTFPAAACDTPVYRYAFENWMLDDYELLVFREGPEPATPDFVTPDETNVRVQSIDVTAEMDESLKRVLDSLRETHPDLAFPYTALCYPQWGSMLLAIWSDDLETAQQAPLFDSPVRTEIVKALYSGSIAVWVLLESGDAAKDDAAERLLKEHLADILQSLSGSDPTTDASANNRGQSPVIDSSTEKTLSEPSTAITGDCPLLFPVLRVSKTDPAERVFVQMLLHSEPDLKTFDAPMAFPIYGRGRALYALIGDGINADMIGEACWFLVTGCSCMIKMRNPGTDLLLKAKLPKGAVSRPAETPALAVNVADVVDEYPPSLDPTRGVLWSVLAGLGGALVLAVAASIFIASRRKNG